MKSALRTILALVFALSSSIAVAQQYSNPGDYPAVGKALSLPLIPSFTVLGNFSPFNRAATPTPQPARQLLTKNTTFFVRTTGSDFNSCTQFSPCLTIQHVVNILAANYDTAGFTVTIDVGAGSFAGFGIKPTSGGGIIQLNGAGSGSTTITAGPNDGVFNVGETIAWNFFSQASWGINKVTLSNSTANTVTVFSADVSLILGDAPSFTGCDVIFTGSGSNTGISGIVLNPFALIAVSFGNLTFSRSGQTLASEVTVHDDASFLPFAAMTVTGTPTYSQAFFVASGGGATIDLAYGGATISGAATGPKWNLSHGAMLATFHQPIPGSRVGIIDTSSSVDGAMPSGAALAELAGGSL